MILLDGITSDLTGWLAMLGLAALIRDCDGVKLGWLGDIGAWPWGPAIEGITPEALGRLVLDATPAPRPKRHRLWLGAGQQTPESTLLGIRGFVDSLGAHEAVQSLVTPHDPVPGCPTWRLSPDCSTPRALQAGSERSSGRPIVEWLAAVGLSHYTHINGLWLKKSPRRAEWLVPRGMFSARTYPMILWHPTEVTRWTSMLRPTDQYRRQAGPPTPTLAPLGC